MKVRLYIENENYYDEWIYKEVDLVAVPRIGETILTDWDCLKETIANSVTVWDYRRYFRERTMDDYCAWFKDKRKRKPSVEQIVEDLYFDEVNSVKDVIWMALDGKDDVRVLVGEM